MSSTSALTWSSSESPLQIEYSNDLLREVNLQSAGRDSRGTLFGVKHRDHVRVLVARAVVDLKDPALTGLQPVGMFVARVRGDVFLTESDLERFERLEDAALVALVIAGAKAGFFLREADGSIQTIKSYREFALTDAASPALAPVGRPPISSHLRRPRHWTWGTVAACLGLVAIPLMAAPYLLPLLPPAALGLTVRGQNGQVVVDWNAAATARKAALEIIDGPERTTIAISGALAHVTYTPATSDVSFLLTAAGHPRPESARFVSYEPARSLRTDVARSPVAEFDAEAGTLRIAKRTGRPRIARLQKSTGGLLRRIQ